MTEKISESTNINTVNFKEQGDDPAAPASGFGFLYVKSTGVFYMGSGGVPVGPLGESIDPMTFVERVAPGAPPTNQIILFAADDSGETRLYTVDHADNVYKIPNKFVDLIDAPADLTGHAGEAIVVNGTADALDFATPSATDAAAIHDNVSGEIAAVTDKATPVDADVMLLEDSAASNAKKKLSWANLKATLKTYFDTLYAGLTHATRHQSGGADAIKLDDLAAPDDNTDLNASTSAHGLLKKLDNNAAHFLDGTGAWSTPGGGGGGGVSFGQTIAYPTSFTGDVQSGDQLYTNMTDVSAFDAKTVENSRILHVTTKGSAKDQKLRLALGTTKAGAFDVRVCFALGGFYWANPSDSYMEIRLSTSGDSQIAVARILTVNYDAATAGAWWKNQGIRVGGASIAGINDNMEFTIAIGMPYTIRIVRDGSNVISFYIGIGNTPMVLIPVIKNSDLTPFTTTVSGTLARVEVAIHTVSGAGASAEWNGYLDYIASV